jgi:hypothetical protein
MIRSSWFRASMLALIAAFAFAPASAMAKKPPPVEVCKHGCEFRTIQDAVDETGKKATINVHPGTYREGVVVEGSKHDGLTIQGTKKKAKRVVLQGKNAKDPNGQPANNGIETLGVDGVRVLNLKVTNYLANGIHFVGPDVGRDAGPCKGYLTKNVIAAFNRSYGIFAFNCIGGRMTKSVGYGQGDSAFYVGATPPQTKPKWTKLDHLEAYENVLGYSGTNSKYVRITKGNWYNNGVGIVPNTLDSEPYEPSAEGIIENNNIFWNNFNYFLPNSRVQTVSNGLGQLGSLTINFPTGAGIVMLGSTGWVIQNNQIFGNFKWGAAAISDAVGNCEGPAVDNCPTGDDAMSVDNQFINNQMGRDGTDTNGVDFFVDGSGRGNCFQGNVSSTFDPSGSAKNENLYPTCPAPAPPASGTGTPAGDASQFGDLASYVLSTPPETQECSWIRHDHPPFEKFTPLTVTPGPTCP